MNTKMTEEQVAEILKQAVPIANVRVLHHMEGGINHNNRLKVAVYDRDTKDFRSWRLEKQRDGSYHLIDDSAMVRDLRDPFIVKGMLARAVPGRDLTYAGHIVQDKGEQLIVTVLDNVSKDYLCIELVLNDGRYEYADEYINSKYY